MWCCGSHQCKHVLVDHINLTWLFRWVHGNKPVIFYFVSLTTGISLLELKFTSIHVICKVYERITSKE
jgi:hypothetical protein